MSVSDVDLIDDKTLLCPHQHDIILFRITFVHILTPGSLAPSLPPSLPPSSGFLPGEEQ